MKILMTMLTLMVLCTSVSFSAPLTDKEISLAIQVGRKAASERQDFVYNAMDTDRAYGNINVQLQARAYSMTPFCSVAGVSLMAKKNYEEPSSDYIASAATHFNVVLVFDVVDANTAKFGDIKVIGLQGDKVIKPVRTYIGDYQVITKTFMFNASEQLSVGGVIAFDDSTIDHSKPLTVKVIARNSKELTFNFDVPSYSNDKTRTAVEEYKVF